MQIPSAEGPLKSTASKRFSFKTVPEFKVMKFHPSNTEAKIYPGTQWLVRFSNTIHFSWFDASKVKITPPLPGMHLPLHVFFES